MNLPNRKKSQRDRPTFVTIFIDLRAFCQKLVLFCAWTFLHVGGWKWDIWHIWDKSRKFKGELTFLEFFRYSSTAHLDKWICICPLRECSKWEIWDGFYLYWALCAPSGYNLGWRFTYFAYSNWKKKNFD